MKELLNSKKFVVALVAVVTAVLVRLGVPEVEVEELIAIVSPFLTYIGAQGFADLGKSKAQIEEGAPSEPLVINNTLPPGDDSAILAAIERNRDAVRSAIQ